MKLTLFNEKNLNTFLPILQDESWMDFLLSHIDPTLSLKRIRARVVGIEESTQSTKTFLLKPNSHWKGFIPGQHVRVSFPVKGRWMSRAYSLTSSPSDSVISITVKRQKDGLFSNALHENLKIGSILEVSPAEGNFTLSEEENSPLLFLAGGSGITPIFSILKYFSTQQKKNDIKVLYFNKYKSDIIFHSELLELSQIHSNLEINFLLTEEHLDGYRTERLNSEMISELIPDIDQRKIYLCGPGSLQKSAEQVLSGKSIHKEIFQMNLPIPEMEKKEVKVFLKKQNREIKLSGIKPILMELEDNGIFPPSGCRMGICHTCKCEKTRGISKNLDTGHLSIQENESIQLCMSRAESDLELNL
ncbi:MAG: ferredoxin reductase [Leptospiraceae bacterium]|nr:ferredoxin reductase [Leptospiraceae bacterium]MCP5510549.1 ferredoxin reductase [Leptospiraceae bacterium]